MFAKSFRVKSNSAIKGSDRRKLRADVQAAFSLSADQLSRLIPNKEDLNVVKMYLHKGEAVTVYVLNKNPIFFEMDKRFYPTVYTLWTCPDLLASFTTWPAVLPKLVGGADLMLPGVILPPIGLPEVLQGDLCAITLVGNRAPVAIGLASMSTAEMLEAGMKGKGITTLHTYLDQLWAFGEKTHPPVIAAEHSYSEETGDQEEEKEEVEEEVNIEAAGVENVAAMLPSAEGDAPDLNSLSLNVEPEPEPVASPTEQDSNSEVEASENIHLTEASKDADSQQDAAEIARTTQEQMDEILLQCFLHALKRKVKKADLPLLASTFLKNHMYPCCPEGRTLDVKKSSYKKLSKFLHSMQQKQIIQVKEFSKGVESIAAVNWDHADLKSFVIAETATDDEVMKIDRETEIFYQPPEISSFYSVSSRLLPLFEHAGLKKDATLSSVDVRNIITSYVKSNELIDACNKNYVIVNPTLCDCILEKCEHHTVTKLKWDDLFARCLERLQECHQVTFPGQKPIIRKGCIKHIIIDVVQRASNKKVTLIKNLEVYGIDPQAIGNALQLKAQASVTLSLIPGTKDKMVVQVQGNQVNHVAKLLTEEYSIPSKYIQGLNKAPKSGKKRR
ncbi:eukaryotic translation initiation factor 2D isoform X2 [Mobula birostris]|uniref:eukaryotic translation initiation factor 2D isoform X2 n=1 Tax=Mobula birostris TaxID=1983395 RepID=UPI003B2826F9